MTRGLVSGKYFTTCGFARLWATASVCNVIVIQSEFFFRILHMRDWLSFPNPSLQSWILQIPCEVRTREASYQIKSLILNPSNPASLAEIPHMQLIRCSRILWDSTYRESFIFGIHSPEPWKFEGLKPNPLAALFSKSWILKNEVLCMWCFVFLHASFELMLGCYEGFSE